MIAAAAKSIAVLVALVAILIALSPHLLYADLPPDLTLDFTKPTTMIVTGANSGLGLATVQHFAHNSQATIIMACRSETRCQAAKQHVYDALGNDVVQANLQPMTLDISQRESIEAFAKALQGQPIHILINNAGLAGATPDLIYNKETGVENHIHTNHLGHVLLVHCLWKNLLLAKGARIVAVSSVMALPAALSPTFGWYDNERFDHGWNVRMYGCSKRANLFWANEMHHRYYSADDNTGSITTTVAHPGFTHTSLCKSGCKGENKLGRYFANLELLQGNIKMSPEDGALSQAYAAVVPQSGVYLGPAWIIVGPPKIVGTTQSSWIHMSYTREESQQLWDKTMKALGIKVFGDYQIPVQTVDQETETVEQTRQESKESEADKVEEEEEEDSSEDEEAEKVWNTYLGDGEYQEAGMF